MGDASYKRSRQRLSPSRNPVYAFDERALATVVVDTSDAVRYDLPARYQDHEPTDPNAPKRYESPGAGVDALTANDASPLAEGGEPTHVRIVLGEGVGKIGLWPVGLEAACKLAVWTKARVPSTEEGHVGEPAYVWVRVAVVEFVGDESDVETIVETRFRDVFVQVVEGAAEETPVTVLVGVC
jgi:hypothetical protein